MKKNAPKQYKSRWLRKIIGVILISLSMHHTATNMEAKEELAGHIIYLKGGDKSVEATLLPESPSGRVATESRLFRYIVDSEEWVANVSELDNGKGRLIGEFPKLPDGPHKASIQTLQPSQKTLDKSERLIFIDSKPPVIELIEPVGVFPHEARLLLFKVTDPENGSGLDVDRESVEIKVHSSYVEIAGKNFVLINQEVYFLLRLKFPSPLIEGDPAFTIDLTIYDRSGNPGHFVKEFHCEPRTKPAFQFYNCGYESYVQTRSAFIVHPLTSSLNVRRNVASTLDLMIAGYNGDEYRYPPAVEKDLGPSRSINRLSPYFQEMIGKQIEVTSLYGNLEIQNMPDDDNTDGKIPFKIHQKHPVNAGTHLGLLKIRYPVAVNINPDANFCRALLALNNSKDCIYRHISEERIDFRYETIIYPVELEVEETPYKLSLFEKDESLIAQVDITPLYIFDDVCSWFEVGNEKQWFERYGNTFRATIPVQEGLVRCNIALCSRINHSRNGNLDENGKESIIEQDYLVRMTPPQISNFRYNRSTNQLTAIIADKGTPLEQLQIRILGAGLSQKFEFNTSTGEFLAELPFIPLSITTATLKVTDRADQTTTSNCKIFGKPEGDHQVLTTRADHNFAYGASVTSMAGIKRRIGMRQGETLVEICRKTLQQGLYFGHRFIPFDAKADIVNLVPLKSKNSSYSGSITKKDRRLPRLDNNTLRAPGQHNPTKSGQHQDPRKHDIKLFYGSYDQGKYEIGRQQGIPSAQMVIGNKSGNPLTIYYLLGYKEGKKFIPTVAKKYGIGGIRLGQRVSNNCQIKSLDMSAPFINAEYDPQTSKVTAIIHDHGMPVNVLDIEYTGRADLSYSNAYFRKPLPFSYENGIFVGSVPLPKRGEIFILGIVATDKAGNRGIATLKISVPRSPPEVKIDIETRQTGSTLRRNAVDMDALITAEACDDSRLNLKDTKFWLDDNVLLPFNFSRPGDSIPWDVYQNHPFKFRGLYATRLDEGSHKARFQAKDVLGLSAETTETFEFLLPPIIRNFRIVPHSLHQIGGPFLAAMIYDQGDDISQDGIMLYIDDREIDAKYLFYDKDSGYFAVEGDIPVDSGSHLARLVVKDNHGNQDIALLRFVSGPNYLIPKDLGEDGRLSIDNIRIKELKSQNGDGRINPGERVRLFIALKNQSDWAADQCHSQLVAENDKLTIETQNVDYGRIGGGASIIPTRGFDLGVDDEVLSATASDPLDTHLYLAVQCDGQIQRRLPFKLPIYQPTLTSNLDSVVDVDLDALPSKIASDQIVVRGDVSSSGADIVSMTIHVNNRLQREVRYKRHGGHFEASIELTEGENVIVVKGQDATGARGADKAYIFRTSPFFPPTVNITSPREDQYFVCEDLVVNGTFNTGSGVLSDLYVDIEKTGHSSDCSVSTNGESFNANCGAIDIGGTYDVKVSLETDGGFEATDEVSVRIGGCT